MAKQGVGGSGWQVEDRWWECGGSKAVHTSVLEKAGAASKPLEPLLAAATCVPAAHTGACLVAIKSPLVPRSHLMAALPGQGPAAAPDWGRNSPAAAPSCVTQNKLLFHLFSLQAPFPLVFTPSMRAGKMVVVTAQGSSGMEMAELAGTN